MTYELNLSATTWNLAPTSEAEEILQNVKCLLMTAKGTVFNYRAFGVDTSMIDSPINAVKQKFIAEVAAQIQRYEPRAKLKKITWQTSEALDGKLEPVLTIEI